MVTYYVNGGNGSDSSDGLAKTRAFATLTYTTGVITDGDRIGIASNTSYREQIEIDKNNIGIFRWGGSAKPIIYGSDDITSLTSSTVKKWTNEVGNLWSCAMTTEVKVAAFDGTIGTWQSGSTGEITSVGDWKWDSNKFYTLSTVNPSGGPTTIEAGQRYCLHINPLKAGTNIDGIACHNGQLETNAVNPGGGISIGTGCSNTIIQNCDFYNNHGFGVQSRFGNDITIQNNYINNVICNDSGHFGDGIYIGGHWDNNVPARNIYILNNVLKGWFERQGVAFTACSGFTIDNNNITIDTHGVGTHAIDIEPNINNICTVGIISNNNVDVTNGNGISCGGAATKIVTKMTINDNIVDLNNDGNGNYGIQFSSCHGNELLIKDNEVYNADAGINIQGAGTTGNVKSNLVVNLQDVTSNRNNIAFVTNATGTASHNVLIGGNRGVIVYANASILNNTIINAKDRGIDNYIHINAKNNIIYADSGIGTSFIRDFTGSGVWDYNCYWDNGGGLTWYYPTTNHTTLAGFTGASSQDLNSIYTNPLLDTTTYKLPYNSPCVDSGTGIGETLDYFGNAVGARIFVQEVGNVVDLGAHEYSGPQIHVIGLSGVGDKVDVTEEGYKGSVTVGLYGQNSQTDRSQAEEVKLENQELEAKYASQFRNRNYYW